MSDQKKTSDNYIPEFIRKNIFRPVTLGILFLVLTAQVLVVLHIHHSKSSSGPQLSRTHIDSNRKNVTLKPLKLDQVKYQETFD